MEMGEGQKIFSPLFGFGKYQERLSVLVETCGTVLLTKYVSARLHLYHRIIANKTCAR